MEDKIRILAVDDEPLVLELLKRILEGEGFAVTLSGDGESALAALRDIKPSLVLLDIRMPGLNGYHVLQLIRETSRIPVLMLTGLSEEDAIVRSFNLGADDYIRKPFATSVLVARVRAALRRTRAGI